MKRKRIDKTIRFNERRSGMGEPTPSLYLFLRLPILTIPRVSTFLLQNGIKNSVYRTLCESSLNRKTLEETNACHLSFFFLLSFFFFSSLPSFLQPSYLTRLLCRLSIAISFLRVLPLFSLSLSHRRLLLLPGSHLNETHHPCALPFSPIHYRPLTVKAVQLPSRQYQPICSRRTRFHQQQRGL